MRLRYCDSYEETGVLGASCFMEVIRNRPNALVCTATGSSPTGLYRRLAMERDKDPRLFSNLRVIPLDEWVGLPSGDEGSCGTYIRRHITGPLHITSNRYFPFDPTTSALETETSRIRDVLQAQGPIDICILGLGKNGHLGFNEPDEALIPHCHVAQLSPASMKHAMVSGALDKPRRGLTLGIADILASKTIILLISGEGKQETVKRFLQPEITTRLPASFLWLHPNTYCFIDRASLR